MDLARSNIDDFSILSSEFPHLIGGFSCLLFVLVDGGVESAGTVRGLSRRRGSFHSAVGHHFTFIIIFNLRRKKENRINWKNTWTWRVKLNQTAKTRYKAQYKHYIALYFAPILCRNLTNYGDGPTWNAVDFRPCALVWWNRAQFPTIKRQTVNIQILFGHFTCASTVELWSYSFLNLFIYLRNNTTTTTSQTTYSGFTGLVGVADGGIGNTIFRISLHKDDNTVLSNMWTVYWLTMFSVSQGLFFSPKSLVHQTHDFMHIL